MATDEAWTMLAKAHAQLFPPLIDYWRNAFGGAEPKPGHDLALSIVQTMDRKRPAMILERLDGSIQAAITPELAKAVGVDESSYLTVAELRAAISGQGVVFHDPDFLFYLSGNAAPQNGAPEVRRLSQADRAIFETFQSESSIQDLEDAYVELDHWAVFGCFRKNRLVSAASAILWNEGPIADLGVLTLPDERGQGHARAAVNTLNTFIRREGYEPQYRCQLDNHASVALAKACGLTLFGKWVVGAVEPELSTQ